MACGTDPFHLVDAGVAAAAALSGGAAPRAAKHLPASLDGFGWWVACCAWLACVPALCVHTRSAAAPLHCDGILMCSCSFNQLQLALVSGSILAGLLLCML